MKVKKYTVIDSLIKNLSEGILKFDWLTGVGSYQIFDQLNLHYIDMILTIYKA